MNSKPKISAIICNRNNGSTVGEAIDSLLRQNLPARDYEIIVVDNASTDGSWAKISSRSNPRFRAVRHETVGLSSARNAAAAAAEGEILAYMDADATATSDWLPRLMKAFDAHPQAGVVGGTILVRWEVQRPAWWCEKLDEVFNHFRPGGERLAMRYPRYPYGTNFAVRAAVLREVGGFDVGLGRRAGKLLGAEETELCLRVELAGWKVFFEPGAVVYHRAGLSRLSRSYIYRRAFMHGRSLYLLEKKHRFESPQMPTIRQLLAHAVRQIAAGRFDIPCKKYLMFRFGYRWQRLIERLIRGYRPQYEGVPLPASPARRTAPMQAPVHTATNKTQ